MNPSPHLGWLESWSADYRPTKMGCLCNFRHCANFKRFLKYIIMSLPTLEFAEMHDSETLDRVLVDWKIDSMQLEKGELFVHSEQVVFPDLVVERSRQNLAKRDKYEIPPATTLFCFFKPGSATGQWCGFEVPESVLLVNQSGREHFAILPNGYEHISITIDNNLLAAWDLLPYWMSESPAISQRSVIPLAEPDATRFRQWLFGQFASRRRLKQLSADPEGALLFRERLLGGLGHFLDLGFVMQGAQVCRARTINRFPMVRRACAIVDERIEATLSTEQVAGELGVNLRTLQRGFAEVFGLTPYQYVQLRKLVAARRELRQAPKSAKTVSQVAIRYGFTELGRFSVHYRQMFGELPSDTLKEGTRMFRAGAG